MIIALSSGTDAITTPCITGEIGLSKILWEADIDTVTKNEILEREHIFYRCIHPWII
jgi:hypothetical protein